MLLLQASRAYLQRLHVSNARRQELMSGSQQRQPGQETEVTAELDNKGLVQLQQQIMQQQDQELEQMEKTVVSTKVTSVQFYGISYLCMTSTHSKHSGISLKLDSTRSRLHCTAAVT